MAWRPHSRIRIDPTGPEGCGTCDRCGFGYNLKDLVWQYQWRGDNLTNTRFRVCTVTCLDVPSDFLRPIVIPADPVPLDQPRPEPFSVDESSDNVWGGGEVWGGGTSWE